MNNVTGGACGLAEQGPTCILKRVYVTSMDLLQSRYNSPNRPAFLLYSPCYAPRIRGDLIWLAHFFPTAHIRSTIGKHLNNLYNSVTIAVCAFVEANVSGYV
jgi:hypothetical protein